MSKLFSSKIKDFENEALEIHNQYRRDHGVPPLALNKEISSRAQKWAEELAKRDAMVYSENRTYGESIYCGWTSDPNTKIRAKDCVEKWYSEINQYSFGREPEVLSCGHFTQIVWKDTKELGVGSATSKSGKLYVVANYHPPGNYSRQFTQNVLPPGALEFRSQRETNNNVPTNRAAQVLRDSKVPAQRDTNNNVPTNRGAPVSRDSKNDETGLVEKLKTTTISLSKFEDDCLKTHNFHRKNHGVPPLVYSRKLANYAEEWAKVLVKRGSMKHRDQNEYGENIFYAWSSDPNFDVPGRQPVDDWYSEIKDHTFNREPRSFGTGHFTQVVWKDTKEVGVGVARSKDGKVFVVANYYPPGNMVGSFASKVPPPLR